MKKTIFLILIFISALRLLQSQIVNKEPLSPRITGYKIDAELDPEAKTVMATMDAFWVNISSDKVPEIRLHMYLNAFRSNKTTLYDEFWRSPGPEGKDLGWIEIKSMEDKKGNDLKPFMQFISPDDGNPDDMTVLNVKLPEAVKPGDTVFINIRFVSKLPSEIINTGYSDDFFFVAQWFPKFGVYEPAGMRYATKGEWNCHQYHINSEYYSNHSVYDVKITLPKEYIVGTGGMLMDEKEIPGGKKRQTWRAEDIVDFVWTAWPGYAVHTDQWNHVKITFLSPPERKDQVTRQLNAVKNALEYLTKNVGPYPWPHLTFVDPPAKGKGAAGMEYTTLFTTLSAYGIPEYLHLPEMATVHELGHAYFMGILASNEFEEPWLDEGVNSFWEERIMDHYWGQNSGFIDHPLLKAADETVMGRLQYVTSGSRQAVSNAEYAWNYPHGTYGMMSYMKAATWLYTLMGIIGEETMDSVFREYYREWALKHPSGKDFIAVVNKVVHEINGDKFGPDMNWFFDQTTYGTGICDYKVKSIFNKIIPHYEGAVYEGDSIIAKRNESKDDTVYTAIVQLERAGEVMLPVDILIRFDNGDQVLEKWDGKSRVKDFNYTGTKKVEWVKIDPDYKIKMDVNYINNSMTLTPDRKPVRRISDKLISVMQFLINFISL
jgi:hypothetical protein